MEDEIQPQLTVQDLHGRITGKVAPKVCDRCILRRIVYCNGYPTEEKSVDVFKGEKYETWSDVVAQAACSPQLSE